MELRRYQLVGHPLDHHHEVLLVRAPLNAEGVVDEALEVVLRVVDREELGPRPGGVVEVAGRVGHVRWQWHANDALPPLVTHPRGRVVELVRLPRVNFYLIKRAHFSL